MSKLKRSYELLDLPFSATKEDILIILGDAGINYYGGKKDIKLKENEL